ncbi:MAG TPA: malto-oligosyltrehalose synthase [Streptomyces sp.]|nr:malto-oligosyltrehalose synthase [Streptomyces sp.]
MTPTATYRLQLQPDFPFSAAEEAVPRLARLGVSHLHLSPVLTAVPGSTHGYDVTDHSSVREELGGEAGLRALSAAARAHGLGLVLDIVPNHMAVPADTRLNRALWETLREGRTSPYARWFDVDWDAGGGRMLLPVLGGPLRAEAAAGIRIPGDGTLRCGPHVLPLRAGTDGLALPALLDAQHYRLAWWRLGRTELNYRRFFTISSLIGLRVEDREVFDATHATVLRLLRENVVDGLRVDHPDGLADPGGYLRQLHEATGGRWTVVEKILARDETLPAGWPVAGTTGYDALHRLDGVFTDPVGHADLACRYREETGAAPDLGGEWAATLGRASREVLTAELAAETDRVTRAAAAICEHDGLRLRDHAPWALRKALRELLIRLPVYRPYVRWDAPAREEDAALLEEAADGARTTFAVPREGEAVDVMRDLALGRLGDGRAQRGVAAHIAQLASALRAKAVEDTAFYRYAPLLSATEVGGDPGRPAVPPEEFHAYCARIQRDWPATGVVLSTHDTKRSADVRAALAVLSECPQRWSETLSAVREETARMPDDGHRPPEPHVEWVAWQTAYGLGEPDAERLTGAVLKAVREAGVHTTWTEPDPDYEAALGRFVAGAVCGPPWAAMEKLVDELRPHARATALGAVLVQLTMPGVPELYWGTERHLPSLVDPDNRRVPELIGAGEDGDGGGDEPGGTRLRLTRAALRLRREHPEWFGAEASYAPLHASGPAAGHCLAFVRSGAVASVVTRLSLRLAEAGGWAGTELELPAGRWREVLSGRTVTGRCPVEALLADEPVALLVRQEE